MRRKKNEKIIVVNTSDYDSLVASIEKVQGVRVKKTRRGIEVYFTKQKTDSLNWGTWENRSSISSNDLISVFPKKKSQNEGQVGKHFSAILAKR